MSLRFADSNVLVSVGSATDDVHPSNTCRRPAQPLPGHFQATFARAPVCLEVAGENISTVPCVRLNPQQLWDYNGANRQLRSLGGAATCIGAGIGSILVSSKCSTSGSRSNPDQAWDYDPSSGRMRHETGQCLEAVRGGIELATCAGRNSHQRWALGTMTG